MPHFSLSSLASRFRDHLNPGDHQETTGAGSSSNPDHPPEWTAAPEAPHQWGRFSEASEEDYQKAEAFCERNPRETPHMLTQGVIEQINAKGCAAWGLEWPDTKRFRGTIRSPDEMKGKGDEGVIRVATEKECKDSCLLSNLPIAAGLYDIQGKRGVYYEVTIHQMEEPGIIAIGTACRPYPDYRLPGWNRESIGLHLDDLRKFYEDPNGGQDYDTRGLLTIDRIKTHFHREESFTIGCGYHFETGDVFFTYEGVELTVAFPGRYLPRNQYDIYAAVGATGKCKFDVNFGAAKFRWKEADDWAWRVEGHVGRFSREPAQYSGPSSIPQYGMGAAGSGVPRRNLGFDDEDAAPPSYDEVRHGS